MPEVLLLRTATNQHADVKDPFFTETHNTFYYLESHRPIEIKKNKRTTLETSIMAKSSHCYDPTFEEAVRFDPTTVNLPEGWSLTEFSTLKG